MQGTNNIKKRKNLKEMVKKKEWKIRKKKMKDTEKWKMWKKKFNESGEIEKKEDFKRKGKIKEWEAERGK